VSFSLAFDTQVTVLPASSVVIVRDPAIFWTLPVISPGTVVHAYHQRLVIIRDPLTLSFELSRPSPGVVES
jgi:hypothetical protein